MNKNFNYFLNYSNPSHIWDVHGPNFSRWDCWIEYVNNNNTLPYDLRASYDSNTEVITTGPPLYILRDFILCADYEK